MMMNLPALKLSHLPNAEDDEYEFKSSSTPHGDLKKKLNRAMSGFANSGGGYFIAGVDDHGSADGGVPLKLGNQDLRDWVDQVVHLVEPTPLYEIALLENPDGRGVIDQDHCVLVLGVHESTAGPHMANDNRYYIRAGAHTVAARHFIVDSIWARRHVSRPRLVHVFRSKPGVESVLQLGVVALTSAPAIEVEIDLDPLGEILKAYQELFPLQIPLIDRDTPFFLTSPLGLAQ